MNWVGMQVVRLMENGMKHIILSLLFRRILGNQWITFTVTNYTDDHIYASLRDSQGNVLITQNGRAPQSTCGFLTRTEGADSRLDRIRILTPGKTYYIKTGEDAYPRGGPKGNVTISVASTADDNWGTYDNADPMTVGSWKSGKLEKNDDIKASFVNENRVLLSEVSVEANTTNNPYVVTGNGQRIYVRVQAGNDEVTNANYSIKVSIQNQTISKLTLRKYKRNNKIGWRNGERGVSVYYGLKKRICKLDLLLYEKSLILYLMVEQIGGASYGNRSKNFIFTRRAGETGNT